MLCWKLVNSPTNLQESCEETHATRREWRRYVVMDLIFSLLIETDPTCLVRELVLGGFLNNTTQGSGFMLSRLHKEGGVYQNS